MLSGAVWNGSVPPTSEVYGDRDVVGRRKMIVRSRSGGVLINSETRQERGSGAARFPERLGHRRRASAELHGPYGWIIDYPCFGRVQVLHGRRGLVVQGPSQMAFDEVHTPTDISRLCP